jgi:hypothetical protein
MRGKPRPSDPVAKQPLGEAVELGRERIAWTAKSSYNVGVARPTAGQAGSNACGDMSSAVRHSAQEPTEATMQKFTLV